MACLPEEIAFLVLECARLGDRKLAAKLVEGYRRMLPGEISPAVFHFHVSRRAAVRTQIMARRALTLRVEDRSWPPEQALGVRFTSLAR